MATATPSVSPLMLIVVGVVVVAGIYFVTRPSTTLPPDSLAAQGGSAAGTVGAIGSSLTGLAAGIAGAIESANNGANSV